MNFAHAEVATLDPTTMRTLCEEYIANNYIDPETSERLGVKRGQHAGAIRVAQAAFDTETFARLRVDVVVCQILFTQRPHGLRVQRRYFCMGIVHARISPFSYFSLIYFPAIHHDGTPL